MFTRARNSIHGSTPVLSITIRYRFSLLISKLPTLLLKRRTFVLHLIPSVAGAFWRFTRKKHTTRNVMIDFVRGAVQYGKCFVLITPTANILFSFHAVNKNSSWTTSSNFAQKISWVFKNFCPQNKNVLRRSKVFKELLASFKDYWGKFKNFTRPTCSKETSLINIQWWGKAILSYDKQRRKVERNGIHDKNEQKMGWTFSGKSNSIKPIEKDDLEGGNKILEKYLEGKSDMCKVIDAVYAMARTILLRKDWDWKEEKKINKNDNNGENGRIRKIKSN